MKDTTRNCSKKKKGLRAKNGTVFETNDIVTQCNTDVLLNERTKSNARTGSDRLCSTSVSGSCAAHNSETMFSSATSKLNPKSTPFMTTTYCAPKLSGPVLLTLKMRE